MAKYVYILTWCDRLENLYGTTLVFKTLRVGFPTAEIHVVDNASLPAVRPVLRQYAQECNANFTQLEQGIAHHQFILQILNKQLEGSAIFVDPDICFWENVEGWSFEQLMAGRLIPKYACEYTGCMTYRRLHTSFLWISNVCVLREQLKNLRSQYIEFEAFRPVMFKAEGIWQHFDTGATLYAALSEQMYAFTEKELQAYDHLFCGTHFKRVASKLNPYYAFMLIGLHKAVQQDHTKLKDAWKMQDDYFNSLAV
jgi:hypothetical protein